MLTRREVMITIHTLRRGIAVPLFDGDEELDEEALPEDGEGEEQDPEYDGPEDAEIMMEGRLVQTSTRVELSYEEGELTGMEGSVTKLAFRPEDPSLITMMRSGAVSTALVFEPHRWHVCVYNTPFSSFEVCVHTLEARNELLEKGELYLDYLIEIHGARTERCKMTVTVH